MLSQWMRAGCGFQRSGWYLDAIGFHLSKKQSARTQKAQIKFQKFSSTASKSSATKETQTISDLTHGMTRMYYEPVLGWVNSCIEYNI